MLSYFRTCALKRNIVGVTFLELLVTLVLISAMAALTWPKLSSFYQTAEAKRLQLGTVQVLNAAHLTALITGQRVLVCLSEDGLHCSPVGKKYWLSVWGERSGQANRRVLPLNASHVQLHWRGMLENQGGMVLTPDMVGNASVWACGAESDHPLWVLSMSRVGEVNVQPKDSVPGLTCKTFI